MGSRTTRKAEAMNGSQDRPGALTFSASDLVKLMAATYLPLCDELEAAGVLDRGKLADTMGLYAPAGEVSSSAALIAALQAVLRRPRPNETVALSASSFDATKDVALRVIQGGRQDDQARGRT